MSGDSYLSERKAKAQIERWEKKFPTAMVRPFVQDLWFHSRSPKAKAVYWGWLKHHTSCDYDDDEREQVALFFGLQAPRIQLVEVNGPMEVVHHFTEVEEDSPKSERISSDHPGLGEVEYVVNRPHPEPHLPAIEEDGREDELVSDLMHGTPEQEERRKDWGPYSW